MMEANVGDYLVPDGWESRIGENLVESDGYSDSSFPGCQFRLPCQDCMVAVNVMVTGRKPDRDGFYRCKIEWVGDGEPSTFSGGKVLLRK